MSFQPLFCFYGLHIISTTGALVLALRGIHPSIHPLHSIHFPFCSEVQQPEAKKPGKQGSIATRKFFGSSRFFLRI